MLLMLVCCLLSTGSVVHADEAARPARGPIVYDSHWEVHHVDPGVRMPGEADSDRSRLRASTPTAPGSSYRDDARLPSMAPPTYLPPPKIAPPVRDDKRRNWIVPTLDDDAVPNRARPEEETESTGWGWLADEVGQFQRERDQESDAAARREAQDEAEWILQRDPINRGLISDELFITTPFQFGSPVDREGERAEQDSRGGATTEMTIEERTQNAADTRNAMSTEEPYGRVDPWDSDRLNASAWDMDAPSSLSESLAPAAMRASAFGRNGDGTRGFSSVTPSSMTRNDGLASSMPPSRSMGSELSSGARTTGAGSDFGVTTPRFETSFGAGAQDGAFGSSQMGGNSYSPTAISDSRWSGDWSSDSGWQGQGGMSEPARPASVSLPVQPAGGGVLHNNGWLANPDR